MKICWDMLEGVDLMKNGRFTKGTAVYIYKESCEKCGESYLTLFYRQSKFCGKPCAKSGENNYNYGKTASRESRKKMSISAKNRPPCMYGKHHTLEAKKRLSEVGYKRRGVSIANWKGDIKGPALTVYDTNKDTLGLYEDIRKQKNTEVLEVKCAYCGQWFPPIYTSVVYRLRAINSLDGSENRLYCSENCKQSCPTYGRIKYPKGFKKATSREVSTYLRQMVFERDSWECQKCGKTIKEAPLHCHHIKGYAQNKILANDVDNCIALCKDCHEEVHKQKGCRYVDLRCK